MLIASNTYLPLFTSSRVPTIDVTRFSLIGLPIQRGQSDWPTIKNGARRWPMKLGVVTLAYFKLDGGLSSLWWRWIFFFLKLTPIIELAWDLSEFTNCNNLDFCGVWCARDALCEERRLDNIRNLGIVHSLIKCIFCFKLQSGWLFYIGQ